MVCKALKRENKDQNGGESQVHVGEHVSLETLFEGQKQSLVDFGFELVLSLVCHSFHLFN